MIEQFWTLLKKHLLEERGYPGLITFLEFALAEARIGFAKDETRRRMSPDYDAARSAKPDRGSAQWSRRA